MIKSDYHVHTTYSDGKNTPEEIILYAIENGVKEIGFSDHSYTFFDKSYCVSEKKVLQYIKEINSLKSKYKDKIKIYLGVEQDYYSKKSVKYYDYVIGSVHYLKVNGEYFPIDESKETLINAVDKYYGGDFYSLAEDYFDKVGKVAKKTGADIIGHFDLVAKYNHKSPFFDEKNARYVKAYRKAVDELVKTGKVFEINTGAVGRGYREFPYPSPDIKKYIGEKGGEFIYSSDAHKKEGICFGYLENGNFEFIKK